MQSFLLPDDVAQKLRPAVVVVVAAVVVVVVAVGVASVASAAAASAFLQVVEEIVSNCGCMVECVCVCVRVCCGILMPSLTHTPPARATFNTSLPPQGVVSLLFPAVFHFFPSLTHTHTHKTFYRLCIINFLEDFAMQSLHEVIDSRGMGRQQGREGHDFAQAH